MNKFYGAIGYAVTKEISPGVYEDSIVTHNYYGEIVRNSRQYQTSENLNDNLNISNEISIIADPFAYENFYAIKFIEFMGVKWKVTNIEVKYPRLILNIGGVYNG